VNIDFRDATAGTLRFTLAVPANNTLFIDTTISMNQTTAANNWTAQLSSAVTDVRIWVQAINNV
jgi:hypothetical protein